MTKGKDAASQGPGTDENLRWLDGLKRQRTRGPRSPHQNVLSGNEGFSTTCVHAGSYNDPETGAVGTPIFQSTTFHFSNETYDSFLEGFVRDIPTYTRYGNPGQWAVQEKIAALEGGESAVVFSSGMAAISTTIMALSNRGGHIISSHDLYGGSYALLRSDMHQIGRDVSFVDSLDVDLIRRTIRDETQIIFFEMVSNPLMKAVPLLELVELCREHNILLIIDNTFLTPISSRPLLLGVDIVIHSGTKYLNGHSDATCGFSVGSRKLIDRIWAQMLRLGGSLDPFACFLVERGMKTLNVRMNAHAEGARQVVVFLEAHEKVGAVYSPYSANYGSPWLHSYAKDIKCGVLSFEVKGGNEAALKLLPELKYITSATSLGGVESLISLPFNTSHSTLTARQQMSIGIKPGLVRLSIGLESPDDLCADLAHALDVI
ncbi:MAG: cystathionine beta-lyase [Rhodospirillaceae bacterium]|nr:MAG: cystathionine beta-lyase [Rhodospirillaceae bacterium]